jgi:hypothetical protein
LPIPVRRFEWDRYENPFEKGEHETTQTFELVERAEMPEHVFSLSAFGLSEPKENAILQPPSRWYLWFFGIAIGCLAIGAFGFRRLRQRARHPSVEARPRAVAVHGK